MAYSLSDPVIKAAISDHNEVMRQIALTSSNKTMSRGLELKDVLHDVQAYQNLMFVVEGELEMMLSLSLITEKEYRFIKAEYEAGKLVPVDRESMQKIMKSKNNIELGR